METRESRDDDGAGCAPESAAAPAEDAQTCQECPIREWTEALREVEGTMRGILPPAFWQHRRAAHKEVLLAVRSLLDSAIEHVEREPEARPSRAPKKIVVQ
jgi:hypothetical protein